MEILRSYPISVMRRGTLGVSALEYCPGKATKVNIYFRPRFRSRLPSCGRLGCLFGDEGFLGMETAQLMVKCSQSIA